jgi:hypothetical protein
MSNDNITVIQNGNVTRVQHGAPSADTASPVAAPYEPNRVGNGAYRLDMHSGELSQSGVTKYAVGQDRDISSVAATLQIVNGQQTVELIPGNPASRTNIKQAIADGLIEPVGPGLWRDKGQVAAAPDKASEGPKGGLEDQQQVDPGAGVFDPEDDQAWNVDIEPLPQHAYDSAMASATVAILSGSDNLEAATTKLAEQAAIPVELAAEYTEHGYAMYERVVAKEVAKAGVEADQKEAFYSWVREHKGKALQHAIQSLTMGRNVQPFVQLAHEFRTKANRG